jgi:hypothetical protein
MFVPDTYHRLLFLTARSCCNKDNITILSFDAGAVSGQLRAKAGVINRLK